MYRNIGYSIFTTLNIELTNQDGEGADSNDSKTFHDKDAITNRVIFELDFSGVLNLVEYFVTNL